MRNLLVFTALFCLCLSCEQIESIELITSRCIRKEIKAFKEDHQDCSSCFIEKAVYKDEVVYIFDRCTGCDGTAAILTNNCDTLGILCGDCDTPSDFQKDFQKNVKDRKRLWH